MWTHLSTNDFESFRLFATGFSFETDGATIDPPDNTGGGGGQTTLEPDEDDIKEEETEGSIG